MWIVLFCIAQERNPTCVNGVGLPSSSRESWRLTSWPCTQTTDPSNAVSAPRLTPPPACWGCTWELTQVRLKLWKAPQVRLKGSVLVGPHMCQITVVHFSTFRLALHYIRTLSPLQPAEGAHENSHRSDWKAPQVRLKGPIFVGPHNGSFQHISPCLTIHSHTSSTPAC